MSFLVIDKSTTWCVCVNVSCLKVSSVQGCPYREVPVYVHIMYVGKVQFRGVLIVYEAEGTALN